MKIPHAVYRAIWWEMKMIEKQQERSQVSVQLDDTLRARLEAEARRSVRSLSGEIAFRLLQSFEGQRGNRRAETRGKPAA